MTAGVALHRGERREKGESWGHEDVLLTNKALSRRHRAFAVSYLHVLWVGVETFDEVRAASTRFGSA